MPPTFSLLIITWNSLPVLPHCLQALDAQTHRDFEVIVYDNGSTDGSPEYVEEQHPQVRLLRGQRNIGFAAGNNMAAAKATGEWLVLLNADAFPEPFWLDVIAQAVRRFPETSMFASRLLMADRPDRIDGTGDACHVSGAVWNRQHRHPARLADNQIHEVFSPQGAAAVIRRSAFEEAGGFDEDFFSYHEDIDLAFRLRLRGHHCLYIPEAVVYHVGSHATGRGSDFAVIHGHRNWVWCWVQNMPSRLLWLYLPQHLLANLFFILYISLKGQSGAILKAKWAALLGLPAALKKRRRIQAQRVASDRTILQALERGLFTPYLQGYRARRMARMVEARGT